MNETAPAKALLSKSARVFLAVCRTRSFSKAAEELAVTQPAVSQCIAQLEAALKLELFDRATRPMSLTGEAEVLCEELTRQSFELQSTVSALQSKNFVKPVIRLGAVESIGRTIGPEIIGRLLAAGSRVLLH
ncbi:MAG: LysR family transcriptional regulator, partial [Duodenibacillus sp.]|nr:LysR family transcriptional regulator [Duodenibacillus sp.]